MRIPSVACCLLSFALLLSCRTTAAQERVLDYHADIAIAADGDMDVTERIRVQAEGNQIRHGIYRDFPTEYRDPHHNRVHIRFDMLDATRDGSREDWHSERRGNGVRIYLGNKSTVVAPGEHEYTLHYRVNRQLGFFADHDELFWNVNGTGWDFPVRSISADIRLPEAVGADRLKAYGYTGVQDSREQALSAIVRDDGAAYAATRMLEAHENLSIVLEFPKGTVAQPSATRKLVWLLADNRNLLYGLVGLIVLWLYCLRVWKRYGRDPEPGPLVAEYDPPDGDSAAALRFVRRMGYDNTCFTAGILGIAAKGGLVIERRDDDKWVARHNGSDDIDALTLPEKTLRTALFAGGNELVFEQKQHVRVQAASAAFKSALTSAFESKYFVTNRKRMLPALIIMAVTMWLTGSDGGFAAIPILIALVATVVAFYHWMKAPTQIGAKLLDRINGFRWYLGVAEKQELDARYRPESRPDLFAAYLPYALALGVGNAWAQRFAEALTPAQMQQAQPGWYSGSSGGFTGAGFASFANDLSSGLGGAIASSSVSPGSSSGSGGGSGGGGGGGGGGGW